MSITIIFSALRLELVSRNELNNLDISAFKHSNRSKLLATIVWLNAIWTIFDVTSLRTKFTFGDVICLTSAALYLCFFYQIEIDHILCHLIAFGAFSFEMPVIVFMKA